MEAQEEPVRWTAVAWGDYGRALDRKLNMKPSALHVCRVIRSPWPGVFATDVDSALQYDRHWHTTFGFGLMERGAHRSLSGRGVVDARAGEVITTNPGEVHDGRPLGGRSRRWRMVYLDP